jgi:hypothetical protein
MKCRLRRVGKSKKTLNIDERVFYLDSILSIVDSLLLVNHRVRRGGLLRVSSRSGVPQMPRTVNTAKTQSMRRRTPTPQPPIIKYVVRTDRRTDLMEKMKIAPRTNATMRPSQGPSDISAR